MIDKKSRKSTSPKKSSRKSSSKSSRKSSRKSSKTSKKSGEKISKSPYGSELNKMLTITTIEPGKFLYHGTTNKFDPEKINDLSNFATIPYAPSSVRRWAQCHRPEEDGEILIYQIKKPLNLLDLDKDSVASSMEYYSMVLKLLKIDGYNQDHLKKYICKNLKIDGYKWEIHEKEYVICKPMKFLKYIGKISCDNVNKLGKEGFWKNAKKFDNIQKHIYY
jgi:hypothetical protein